MAKTKNYDRDLIIEQFEYDPSNEESIRKRSKRLQNLTIKDIINSSPNKAGKLHPDNKGAIGNMIEEHWFGIKNNPIPEPDFVELGIELKVIPLEKRSAGLGVKERTKICNINYGDIIKEQWSTSHARRKLNKILFIYYEYDSERKELSRVKYYDIWNLEGPDSLVIKDDWSVVKDMVEQGEAHLLSESMGHILGACTTGQGGGRDLVTQPKSTIKAKRRAFALKRSFTHQLWLELFKNIPYESVIKSLKIKNIADFERELLVQLDSFMGMSLKEISSKFGISISNGKNAVATIVKKAVGFKNVNSRIKEFDQLGIEIRVVPVRYSDDMPWEAVSFPTFKIKELVNEEWEESDLQEYVDRILFIPIYRDEKKTPLKKRVFGKAFFWSPTDEEWHVIKKEWEMYKHEIEHGKCSIKKVKSGDSYKEVTGLSKESDTQIVHVRPHGKDRTDRDEDMFGNSVVKQSFWLNKGFVHKLIKKSK